MGSMDADEVVDSVLDEVRRQMRAVRAEAYESEVVELGTDVVALLKSKVVASPVEPTDSRPWRVWGLRIVQVDTPGLIRVVPRLRAPRGA
jgi:hypothetical protein